jgi:methylglutaconyl-CoA hydratase
MNAVLETERRGDTLLLWMNRPAARNAIDGALLDALLDALDRGADDSRVRAVVIGGRGPAFCAGADIRHLESRQDPHAAQAHAIGLGRLFAMVDELPKPTLALVDGIAAGGGVGLACACDLVLATSRARFALSEVRAGLVPAIVAPYVIDAIGAHAARRCMLAGEAMDADEAYRVGLAHRVCKPEEQQDVLDRALASLRQGGPRAQATVKELVRHLASRPGDARAHTIEVMRRVRAGDEAAEGMRAFRQKRPPSWAGDARLVGEKE